MTIVSKFLQSIGESASPPIPAPVGTQAAPNPNDAKTGTPNDMDIEDSAPLAKKIAYIIDSLDDSDITDELADIVESYLCAVDPNAEMSVEQAVLMLPLEDCQDLFEELTSYLEENGIAYSDQPSFDGSSIPYTVPADAYPTASSSIFGGLADAPAGSFSI